MSLNIDDKRDPRQYLIQKSPFTYRVRDAAVRTRRWKATPRIWDWSVQHTWGLLWVLALLHGLQPDEVGSVLGKLIRSNNWCTTLEWKKQKWLRFHTYLCSLLTLLAQQVVENSLRPVKNNGKDHPASSFNLSCDTGTFFNLSWIPQAPFPQRALWGLKR